MAQIIEKTRQGTLNFAPLYKDDRGPLTAAAPPCNSGVTDICPGDVLPTSGQMSDAEIGALAQAINRLFDRIDADMRAAEQRRVERITKRQRRQSRA